MIDHELKKRRKKQEAGKRRLEDFLPEARRLCKGLSITWQARLIGTATDIINQASRFSPVAF
jgi:hypothetical protein